MDAKDFRRIALSLDGVEEGSHMGAMDFRVGGRIFATLAHEKQGYGNLMLTPEQQAAFVEELPDVFVPVHGGWGNNGATHIVLEISKMCWKAHKAGSLHSSLYDRQIPINDVTMLAHSRECLILFILALLAGIACLAGNMTTFYLFGAPPVLIVPIAVAATAMPVILAHVLFEEVIIKYKKVRIGLMLGAALLCFAGIVRFAQARLLMADKSATDVPSSGSYVDGAADDPQPKEDEKQQDDSERKIRQMFGEGVLLMMIAAEIMFGYLVGLLTKKHRCRLHRMADAQETQSEDSGRAGEDCRPGIEYRNR